MRPAVEYMAEPKLWTYAPPNVAKLTQEGIRALNKVLTALHRQVYMKQVCLGGFRSLEVTNGSNGWNLHAHELVDVGWVAQYPQWDIERGPKSWKVTTKHPDLAREFTRQCQRYTWLLSTRPDFELDNPDHWYFVDLRKADHKGADEITKYVAKGSQVINAGSAAVLEYLFAVKGIRMVQPFGSMLHVDLEDEKSQELPPRQGECPYDECPDPRHGEWDFVGYGFPASGSLERNPETGTSRTLMPGRTGARDGPATPVQPGL